MLYFISSNQKKIELYTTLLAKHGASFTTNSIADLEEIQSDLIEKIVEHKARQAFERLRQPLFVQDAGWSIAALNGFPGPYIKYMNQWLSSEDFLKLMEGKPNRSVTLLESFGCMNAQGTFTLFTSSVPAYFLDKPAGEGSSVDRIAAFAGFNKPLSLTSPEEWQKVFVELDVWGKLASWIKEQK